MLTKESISKSLNILELGDYTDSVSDDDWNFCIEQTYLAENFLKQLNISTDHNAKNILNICLFLIDSKRVKELLTRLNNKVFW